MEIGVVKPTTCKLLTGKSMIFNGDLLAMVHFKGNLASPVGEICQIRDSEVVMIFITKDMKTSIGEFRYEALRFPSEEEVNRFKALKAAVTL